MFDAVGTKRDMPGKDASMTTCNAGKTCPECGKAILKPRRNQTYCSAACRGTARAREKHTNQPDVFKRTCTWCGDDFEAKRRHAKFCGKDCQQAFNNFWKGKGPKLAMALFDYRVRRVKGSFTDLCRAFSDCRDEQKAAPKKVRKDGDK